jgi:hypothetical protein
MPPYPTAGISAAEDRAMQRAEAEALAPWKQAIALARRAGRAARRSQGATPTRARRAPRHPPAKPHAPIQRCREPGTPAGRGGIDPASPAEKPHAPDRASIGSATQAALSRAAATAPARPLAPIQGRCVPGSPAAPARSRHAFPAQEPDAPERAPLIPGGPAALPSGAAMPLAKPHAPIQGRCELGLPVGPTPSVHADPVQEPLAPFHRPAIGMPAMAATALSPQPAELHAPARSSRLAEQPRLSGRNLRRWQRRQGEKRQAVAGPRASHPLP